MDNSLDSELIEESNPSRQIMDRNISEKKTRSGRSFRNIDNSARVSQDYEDDQLEAELDAACEEDMVLDDERPRKRSARKASAKKQTP